MELTVSDLFAGGCIHGPIAVENVVAHRIERNFTANLQDAIGIAFVHQLDWRIGIGHGVDFRDYFKSELERLQPLASDELIELDSDGISITAKGRLLLRCIAMVFDRHLAEIDTDKRFSRAI